MHQKNVLLLYVVVAMPYRAMAGVTVRQGWTISMGARISERGEREKETDRRTGKSKNRDPLDILEKVRPSDRGQDLQGGRRVNQGGGERMGERRAHLLVVDRALDVVVAPRLGQIDLLDGWTQAGQGQLPQWKERAGRRWTTYARPGRRSSSGERGEGSSAQRGRQDRSCLGT